MSDLVLGIDVGTSAVRVAAVGPAGRGAAFGASGVAAPLRDWSRVHTEPAGGGRKPGNARVARPGRAGIAAAGVERGKRPGGFPAGTAIGEVTAEAARRFGVPARTVVVTGATDGCAAFLATGADKPGEAVTSLGSTLVLKLASAQPLLAPEYGLYSHRIRDTWLAAGASNTGGAVLAQFFTPEAIRQISRRIDPSVTTGLDYYPLPAPGERFPINDPALAPRITPRPADDAVYLHALLEGMANIEALGYRRLAELGGPRLTSVLTVGGGAANERWGRIRATALGVPLRMPESDEAAVGVARLALRTIGVRSQL